MGWLRKHWKGALAWTAGIVGSVVVGKIADHLDVRIISQFWQILVGIWSSINTTVPVPAWLALLTLIVLIALGWKLFKLKRANEAKIGISDQQKAVLQCIAWFYQNMGSNPAFHNIQFRTNLSTLELQVAIDALCQMELITWEIDLNLSVEHGESIKLASLTTKGRAYALDIQRQSTQ